jgi:hypothetical protein
MNNILKLSSKYTGDLDMTQEEYERVEELEMLKDGRVKQDGKKTVEFCKKGTPVKVGGSDKIQLLSSRMAQIKAAKKA